jgi:hypothetical protein
VAANDGIEPPPIGSEPIVLPLYESAMVGGGCRIRTHVDNYHIQSVTPSASRATRYICSGILFLCHHQKVTEKLIYIINHEDTSVIPVLTFRTEVVKALHNEVNGYGQRVIIGLLLHLFIVDAIKIWYFVKESNFRHRRVRARFYH